jgi:hypothetical protein
MGGITLKYNVNIKVFRDGEWKIASSYDAYADNEQEAQENAEVFAQEAYPDNLTITHIEQVESSEEG